LISVVVVTWNSRPELARLIASMNAHLSGEEQLIVVDNDSSESPIEIAREWKGPGLFLRLAENVGFGAGANAGVAESSHEGVVILNADTELRDAGLSALAALAVAQRSLVGPRVLEGDGSLQPSASGPATGIWPWIRALLPSPAGPPALLARTAPWRLRSRTEVAWLTGCALAGPAGPLRQLGPFDPGIHLYGEDLDLGLRAARAGLGSLFAPELCTIVHYGKRSTSQVFGDLGRGAAAENGRAVLRRHYGAGPERRAHQAEVLNLRLRSVVKRVLRRPREWQTMTLAGKRGAAGEVRSIPAGPHPPARVAERVVLEASG
jgi:N-acetylglucosaminyl-diphospho-decaprenol L-rhamnosyltransferase